MDWLKRNWVDVVMGGLILAIAAGVFVVLVRGGLFVSNNANTNPTNTVSVPNPPAPVTSTTTAPTSASNISTTPTPTTNPAPNTQPSPATQPSNTSVRQPSVTPRATASLDVPEIPEAPSSQVAKPPSTVSSATNKPSASSSPTQSSGTTRPTTALTPKPKPTQTITPTQANPINTPNTNGGYSRADFLRNYRVAAGSYVSLERAIRAASQLRARGLPAQHFSSGSTYIVVVGPYSREASARSALARVRQSSPDAILYRPDGTKEGVAAKPTSKPSTKPSGGSGGSGTATLTASYLQVGAFKDSDSANALGEKLRNAGFKPFTKNVSGLLRVLVGPLSATQIQTTRDILKNQGFDAFPITL